MTVQESRKKISLHLVCLLIGLLAFISTIGYGIVGVKNELDNMHRDEQEARDQYLNLALRIQNGFLETVEHNWRELILNGEEANVESMIMLAKSLQGVQNNAANSMIVGISDGTHVFFKSHTNPEYEEYFRRVDDWSPIRMRQVRVVGGTLEQNFGNHDRIFISGTVLQESGETCGNKEYYIFIFFSERIMSEAFISSLNLETMDGVQTSLRIVVYATNSLIFFVTLAGTGIGYALRKLQKEIPNLSGDRIQDCEPVEGKE